MNASVKAFKRYKLLTLGIVGTLIDQDKGVLDYVRPIAKQAGVSIADSAIIEAFGWAEEKQAHLSRDVPFGALLASVYTEMAGVLGLPADAAHAEGLKDSVRLWPAFPDVVPALEALGKRYRLVALSNADNWGFWYLNKTLGEPFDDKVTSEDAGARKPEGEIFAYCLGRQSVHGFNRRDVLHVGRSRDREISGASRMDLATAWIDRRKGKAGLGVAAEETAAPTFHFKSLAEMVEAVETAFRK